MKDEDPPASFDRALFLSDLKKASKKLASEDDASRENDAPESPEKSDRKAP
jgi:hypothetical protein